MHKVFLRLFVVVAICCKHTRRPAVVIDDIELSLSLSLSLSQRREELDELSELSD